MTIIQAIILGVVQGLTEFIPVSSSGHLVLFHELLGVTENGLTFDVALHFGTLLALVLYFHRDILLLINGLLGRNEYRRVAWWLVVATIPAMIAGVLLEDAAESKLRSDAVVAIGLIVVAILMLAAERYARRYDHQTKLTKVTGWQAIIVGFAQVVALVPGMSRSGSTITAGLFAGMERVAATRFSFLLGIPLISGAVAKILLEPTTLHQIGNETSIFIVGITTALVSGLLAIRFLLQYLAHHTMSVFAYYRIGLGILVLVLVV